MTSDSLLDLSNVLGLVINTYRPHTATHGGFEGGAGAGERVEDELAGQGRKSHQPFHEGKRLDGKVFDAVDFGAFASGGPTLIVECGEEPGRTDRLPLEFCCRTVRRTLPAFDAPGPVDDD